MSTGSAVEKMLFVAPADSIYGVVTEGPNCNPSTTLLDPLKRTPTGLPALIVPPSTRELLASTMFSPKQSRI